MSLSAIIFDFDGVLADTERLHLRAFQDVLTEDGIELTSSDYAARYLGLSDTRVFQALARDHGLALDGARLQSLLARKARRYEAYVAAGDVMIPGAADCVRTWSRSLPLAVASGARRVEVESILGAAGILDRFGAIVGAEDVWRGKPAPDPYLFALDRLGLPDASKVVAIEDSLSGLQSIQAAGMHAVAVTTNHPAERLTGAAELVVSSIAELDLERLENLVSSRS